LQSLVLEESQRQQQMYPIFCDMVAYRNNVGNNNITMDTTDQQHPSGASTHFWKRMALHRRQFERRSRRCAAYGTVQY